MSLRELIDSREHLGDSAFYIYDENQILENMRRFSEMPYAHASVHFASMANDNPVLLSMLHKQGFGLFVNSRKHLQLGLSLGFRPEQVMFASTGISIPTMKLLAKLGVHISIDSTTQLEAYGHLHPGVAVGMRLNIEERSKNNSFTGLESRIGIMDSELRDAFSIAQKFGLRLIGTHVYLGTDITSFEDLLAGIDKTLSLSSRFPDLEYIDLGGGFPIQEKNLDLVRYGKVVSERMERYSTERGKSIRLILEPGRAMFGSAANFCVQVTDIKERPDRYLVGVNASATQIPRAMFYEDYNPVSVLRGECSEHFDKPVDIVGSTTYSRDFIGKKIQMRKVKPGDWLSFGHAGSYCYSMITRFLGQALPPEFLQRTDGQIEAIREGESFFAEMDSIPAR